MTSLSRAQADAAKTVFAYLAETDALPSRPLDAAIGFGVFDLALAGYCAELHVAGRVRWLVFTGGIGAGTGDLGGTEADVWREAVRRSHPHIPDDVFVLENRSTNTAENINYTAELLHAEMPSRAFGTGIRAAAIIASPSRLRRVALTMRKLQPDVTTYRSLPAAEFDREVALYTRQGVNYVDHLLGEIDRIVSYPQRGWIAEERVPADVLAAADSLRK
jgi:hypothetical protein